MQPERSQGSGTRSPGAAQPPTAPRMAPQGRRAPVPRGWLPGRRRGSDGGTRAGLAGAPSPRGPRSPPAPQRAASIYPHPPRPTGRRRAFGKGLGPGTDTLSTMNPRTGVLRPLPALGGGLHACAWARAPRFVVHRLVTSGPIYPAACRGPCAVGVAGRVWPGRAFSLLWDAHVVAELPGRWRLCLTAGAAASA